MIFYSRAWKDMTLDDSISEYDRAKLAVWEYVVGDKYTKLWYDMKNFEDGIPMTFEDALEKVRTEDFALIGEMIITISLAS